MGGRERERESAYELGKHRSQPLKVEKIKLSSVQLVVFSSCCCFLAGSILTGHFEVFGRNWKRHDMYIILSYIIKELIDSYLRPHKCCVLGPFTGSLCAAAQFYGKFSEFWMFFSPSHCNHHSYLYSYEIFLSFLQYLCIVIMLKKPNAFWFMVIVISSIKRNEKNW